MPQHQTGKCSQQDQRDGREIGYGICLSKLWSANVELRLRIAINRSEMGHVDGYTAHYEHIGSSEIVRREESRQARTYWTRATDVAMSIIQ